MFIMFADCPQRAGTKMVYKTYLSRGFTTRRMPDAFPAESTPMNQFIMGCPECSMSAGMNSPLSEKEGELQCSANPSHRFCKDENGFLKSI